LATEDTEGTEKEKDIRVSGEQEVGIRGPGDQEVGIDTAGYGQRRRIAGFVHAGQGLVRSIAPYTTIFYSLIKIVIILELLDCLLLFLSYHL